MKCAISGQIRTEQGCTEVDEESWPLPSEDQ